jgi:hypothetical protein
MAVRLAKSALRFKGMHEIVRYDPDGCYAADPDDHKPPARTRSWWRSARVEPFVTLIREAMSSTTTVPLDRQGTAQGRGWPLELYSDS